MIKSGPVVEGAGGRLVVLAPLEPRSGGNGLAMRIGHVVASASLDRTVRVGVLPISGTAPGPPMAGQHRLVTIAPAAGGPDRAGLARFLADPVWRDRLAASMPLPTAARAASPVLADEVVAALGAPAGWPVHVARSSLAPLGVAVAELLAAPWTTLDLDDDDERMLRDLGRGTEADQHHRLVATFGPLYSSVFLASEPDARAVSDRHGFPTSVLPNAIRVPSRPPRTPTSGSILFVGNLTFAPNIDAAATLVERVLPAVRARTRRPVSVTLVGPHGEDPAVLRLGQRPGVVVPGYVEDLGPVYERAEVVVVPLASGAGTRIKLLDAFAHLVPVVATAVAASGLPVLPGSHLLVGDSVDDLAAHAVSILDDRRVGDRLALAARAYVERHHSAPVVARTTTELLGAAARRGRPS